MKRPYDQATDEFAKLKNYAMKWNSQFTKKTTHDTKTSLAVGRSF